MKKLRALWASLVGDSDRRVRLGRILGFALVVLGFVAIGKAWDGAASQTLLPAMFPYLLSGGFLGLGLVITGAMLIFLATLRAERQLLSDRYEQMAKLLSRNLSRLAISANGAESSGHSVIAGDTAYHRPGCRVLQGKEDLMTVPLEQAVAEGLAACRVCDPPTPAEDKSEAPKEGVEATTGANGAESPTESPTEAATSASGTPTP